MLDEDLFLYSLSLFPLYSPSFFPSLSLSLYTLFPLGISADIFADINRFFHVFIVSFIYFFPRRYSTVFPSATFPPFLRARCTLTITNSSIPVHPR